jgi:CHRD domain
MNIARKVVVVIAVALVSLVTLAVAAGAGGRPLSTDLNGAAEVPGPGDANASGHIDLTLNQGQGEACFDLSWSDIDGTVVAAHIHVAPAGVAGPVVVPLPLSSSAGTAAVSACVEADQELIKAIRQNPSGYYVNVHSTPGFDAGAVRGQLGG